MMRRLSTEEFVGRLEHIFGHSYDYSKVCYVDAKTKVTVVCPKHGEFSSMPYNLLAGKGCPLCGRISASSKCRRSLDEVLKLAAEVHGGKYDYSLVKDYKCNGMHSMDFMNFLVFASISLFIL